MALGAGLILLRHGQPPGRFENVAAMRVVALHTIHVPLNHRMMCGQLEFRLSLKMATKARVRIFAGIDDEFAASAAGLDVSAAGTVTGFTTHFAGHGRVGKSNSCVRAGFKFSRDVGVAIVADLVANVMRAGDFQRRDGDSGRRRTRIQEQHRDSGEHHGQHCD